MHKVFLYLILSCVVFISCESEMEIKGLDNIQPHLVVNAVLKADADTNRLYVTHSRTVFFNQRWDEGTYSGWYKGNYQHLKDAEISLTVNKSEYSLPYHKPDSSYIFREQFLKEGDEVRVEVKQGKDIVGATVVIPEPPQILSIDTSSFRRTNWTSGEYVRFRVKIKDNPAQKNYYRLRLNSRAFGYYYNEYSYMSWYNKIYSDDPVLINGFKNNSNNVDYELVSPPTNDFWIFTDNMINGQEYTLDFYTEKMSADYYVEEVKQSIYLQSISEELYNYYYSVLKFKEIDESLNEPVLIYNNVENGLGIVGAVNEVLILEYEDTYERGEDEKRPYPY